VGTRGDEDTAPHVGAPPGVRLGLGYVVGLRADEAATLVAAREKGGPFRSLGDLASRAGVGKAALERLAWAGTCALVPDGLGARLAASSGVGRADWRETPRRTVLWELGIAAASRRLGANGTQLSLPLELPVAPVLPALAPWEAMIADYATTGLTVGRHPIGLLRPSLDGMVSSAQLERLPHGAAIRIAGLVIARQRPATANGVTFLLIEDEAGTVNLIVPPPVYERDRLAVRSDPLIVVEGRLERLPSAGGAISILVRRVASLDIPERGDERPTAEVHDFSPLDMRELDQMLPDRQSAAVAGAGSAEGEFRAVAPAVTSFASGRRR
jgi:error-prone DNA polymerase